MTLLDSFYIDKLEAGCDEAGRGCLAGPVFAAAVILPRNLDHTFLKDSKKLTSQQRGIARKFIIDNAIAFAISKANVKTIDKINILHASIHAMHLAIKRLAIQPSHLLIDGNRFTPLQQISYTCVVKGDQKYKSVAAASILAKTSRDRYMLKQHKQFPYYHWDKNKGYATKLHKEAIKKYGLSPIHRLSFKLI